MDTTIGTAWKGTASFPATLMRSTPAALLLACMLLLAALTQLRMSVDAVQVEINDVIDSSIQSLPVQKQFKGTARVSATVRLPFFSGATFRIIPDERLTGLSVNGEKVDLRPISAAALSDWRSGFSIDLGKYLHPGKNSLQATVQNTDGPGGINIEYEMLGLLVAIPFAGVAIAFSLIFLILARHLHLHRYLMWAGVVHVVLLCLYWFQTPFSLRQFDIFEGGGHLDYLRYLAEHWQLPPPDAGWEYHQPPLYYLTALPAYLLGHAVPQLGWENMLRVVSILYWLLFVVAGLAIIQLYLHRRPVTMLLTAIAFAGWPSGFIHSIRTGNDVAFYAWYTLGLLATCHWWRSKKPLHFYYATICCFLSILSKSNGLALAAVLVSLLSLQWLRASRGRITADALANLHRHSWQLALSISLAMGVAFHTKLGNYLRGTSTDWLLANVSNTISQGLRVSNSWQHFIGFDLHAFVTQHWMSTWDDATGRQYFLNFLLRSSISSEFQFDARLNTLALISGMLVLLLGISLVLRSMRKAVHAIRANDLFWLRRPYELLPILLSGLILVALLAAYRFKAPYTSNTDFRYIYPALLTILVIDAKSFPRSIPLLSIDRIAAPLMGLIGVLWVAFL